MDILTDKKRDSRILLRTFTGSGLLVMLSTLGAAIQKIAIPLPNTVSAYRDLTLCYPDDEQLLSSGSYAGRTLAPNAGRIRDARLPIDGRSLPLLPNEGQHQLHGGAHNLSLTDWRVKEVEEALDHVEVCFEAFQPDGLDGYPGNRSYQVRYRIEDTNWILIRYTAVSDKPTYINMSNHCYWNLRGITENAGVDGDALMQELEICANAVVLNDSCNIPQDIVPVAGTAFDFRSPVTLHRRLRPAVPHNERTKRQLSIGRGYNNAFLLTCPDLRRRLRGISLPYSLKKACVLRDPLSGLQMTMMTDSPALVLYSGGFLHPPSSAIALEAQDIPDIGNLMPERMLLTAPEHPFHREIRFHIV
ncbi:galactose mutarotase [Oribacterium sp. oral taxon 102]|uniref:aldose epimerase family protein n=1 Tax=Oribacterium sp. oral taxon 102 TaxID=671214 RepID=UPI0015B92684|nr:galactose mutarotase [Oribacterium sp. oral taxon 102]NWO21280.1 galactose mutarotase [Oribacterium sp. oral taxon 102]